jgi:hypothetical protein
MNIKFLLPVLLLVAGCGSKQDKLTTKSVNQTTNSKKSEPKELAKEIEADIDADSCPLCNQDEE